MPPKQNQDTVRAARSEAAKRDAETRRRNAAARMQQRQPRPVIVIGLEDKSKTNSNTMVSSYATGYNQAIARGSPKRVRAWIEAGCKFALDNKAVIAAFVAGGVFSYVLSGPSDHTRIILEMAKAQKVMFDTLAPGARDSSGFVASVKNVAQVVGAGAGIHLLGFVWKSIVRIGLQWYFEEY